MDDSESIVEQHVLQCNDNNSHNNNSRTVTVDASEINVENSDENRSTTIKTIITTKSTERRSYRTQYSQEFEWLAYAPDIGEYCSVCRNYWKPTILFFREMEQKIKGIFTSVACTNWKKLQATVEN